MRPVVRSPTRAVPSGSTAMRVGGGELGGDDVRVLRRPDDDGAGARRGSPAAGGSAGRRSGCARGCCPSPWNDGRGHPGRRSPPPAPAQPASQHGAGEPATECAGRAERMVASLPAQHECPPIASSGDDVCLPDHRCRARTVGRAARRASRSWSGTGRAAAAGADRRRDVRPGYTLAAADAPTCSHALPGLPVVQLLSAGVEPWLGRVPDGRHAVQRPRHPRRVDGRAGGCRDARASLRELPRFRDAQRAHAGTAPSHRRPGRQPGPRAGRGRHRPDGSRRRSRRSAQTSRWSPAGPATASARWTNCRRCCRGHDVVVIALPHTPRDRRLVDARIPRRDARRRTLVNVARGALVDTDALLAELRAGRLRGVPRRHRPRAAAGRPSAVGRAEPAAHPPCRAAGRAGWERRAYALVRDQVIRLHRGEPLHNVVGGRVLKQQRGSARPRRCAQRRRRVGGASDQARRPRAADRRWPRHRGEVGDADARQPHRTRRDRRRRRCARRRTARVSRPSAASREPKASRTVMPWRPRPSPYGR